MSAKLLLYVSAHQATIAYWRRGQISFCQDLASDEEGWSRLDKLFQAHSNTPVYIVVDAVEEDFRSETMPHAFGNARREMLSRKLKQIYRNTPYCTAWLQGRETKNRRDDRYLFTALTNPDLLRPWLDILHVHSLPVAGIYLLPMVSQALLGKLDISAPNLLLISEHSAGLRQSFFQNQQLKVSRLTPLQEVGDGFMEAPSGETGDRSHYANEIEKTRFYLNSLRLVTREEQLTVCILDQTDSLGELHRTLSSDPGLACVRLSQNEIFKRLAISPERLSSTSINGPHLFALGAQPPAISLAPPALSRGFGLYRARFALYGLSAATAASAVIWSGANLVLQQNAEKQTHELTAQTMQQESLYLAVARQFPQAPTSAENLLKAVGIAKTIRENSRTPELLMTAVSHALDANPSITLDQLKWKLGSQPADPDDASPSQPDSPTGGTPATGQQWQIGYITGEIRPFSGDYRAAIRDIDTFASSLKKDPAVANVTVQQLPLNVNSAAGLTGTTLEKDTETASAKFKIKVLLK